jgi:hypothetical protein
MTGMPSAVVIRYSRNPQKNREWGGAVPVSGVPGQIGALDGLAGGRARQRGGIDQAQQVMPGGGVAGQFGDRGGQEPAAGPQPLAVPGLAGQVREHGGQVRARVPDPAALAGDARQLLGHRHTSQLRIGQGRFAARAVIPRPAQRGQHMIVEMNVECGQEGIHVVRHKTI